MPRQTAARALHAAIADRFVAARPADLKATIERALGEIAGLVQAGRAYLFAIDEAAARARFDYEWCAAGVEPLAGILREVSFAGFEPLLEPMRRGEVLIVDDAHAHSSQALHDTLCQAGVAALLVAPMLEEGALAHVVGFSVLGGARSWQPWEVEWLSRIGSLFLSLIQRCRAEERLSDALHEKRQYDRLFEVTPALFAVAGFDGYFKVLGQHWEAVLGTPRRELLGTRFFDMVHPDDREATIDEVQRLRDPSYRTSAFEHRFRRAGGSYLWLSWRAVGDPLLGLMYAVADDVTAIKERQAREAERAESLAAQSRRQRVSLARAAEELGGKEQELFQFLDSLPIGVLVLRGDGSPYYSNRAMQALVGLAPESSAAEVNAALTVFRAGELTPCPLGEGPLARALGAEEASASDLELVRDGARVPLHVAATPITGPDGAVRFALGTFQDMSQRRELELQLRQSQKMDEIGRLAGGVAHDFNNVLTAIVSFANFALQDLEPERPAHADVQEILQAAQRAAGLTRQLLAFSRRQSIQPCVMDLASHVETMSRLVRRLVGESIEVELELESDVGNVFADPAAIEQVVVNLAVNARDAMPAGGRLRLGVGRERTTARTLEGGAAIPPGEYAVLWVSDSGTGMDAATQKRIFEPFFTTKAAGHGTGLGLSTVHGIVSQAGGHIAVQSAIGSGSTFRVYLPIDPREVAPRVMSQAPVDLDGHETILLVEDEEQVRKLACRALRRRGYQVLTAGDGQQALALLAEWHGPVDLLLTDVVMPRMSGHELAAKLGARQPGLPILYMSGYTDDIIAKHGVLEPGIELLAKPFTPDSLARSVRTVLDRASHRGPRATKLLLVDDDPQVRRAIGRALSTQGFDVTQAEGIAAAKRAIAEGPTDAVLLDVHLDDGHARELCDWIAEHSPELADKVLLITGGATDPRDDELLARMNGRSIAKPVDLATLIGALAAVTHG